MNAMLLPNAAQTWMLSQGNNRENLASFGVARVVEPERVSIVSNGRQCR